MEGVWRTVRIQHPRNIQVLLGNVEGSIEVLSWVVFGKLVVVDEIGPVPVDERAEGQAVLERQVEVLHVDVLVGGGLALAPQQQTLLGRHLLYRDVLDGETQDDGPDHAEGHF